MNKYNTNTVVFGVGSMGQNHARILSQISNLIGVIDPNEKQGRLIADKFDVPWYKDHKKVIGKIDAAVIAVPTIYHRDVSETLISSGIHCLVEKPLADNVDDAIFINNLAKKKGVVLSVGHIERHNPVVKYAKKAIENREWGDVITMSSQRVSLYPDRIKDVGVVYDLAIHDLDIISYLAESEVKALYAVGGNKDCLDKEDHASIILEFGNGIKGYCEVSWLTPMKVRKLSITCTKAYVILDFMDQNIEVYSSEYISKDKTNLSNMEYRVNKISPEIICDEPLKLELQNFLNTIEDFGSDKTALPLVHGDEGVKVVKLAEESVNQIHRGV